MRICEVERRLSPEVTYPRGDLLQRIELHLRRELVWENALIAVYQVLG